MDSLPVCKGLRSYLKNAIAVVEHLELSSNESVLPETGTIGGLDARERNSIR
jgi:hypothetical protein